MKKYVRFLIVVSVACANLSMAPDFSYGLLNRDDYRLQQDDAVTYGPALSAPRDGEAPYWESFNRWLCFSGQPVEVSCLDADYGGVVRVPTIHVISGAHFYEIGMDPDPKPDCERVVRRWSELLEGGNAFCAYAAPLQEYEGDLPDPGVKDGSVWIINRLKSEKGYWGFAAPENWLEDEGASSGAQGDGAE